MVDSIVLGIIALSAVWGFVRGIVSQLMALAGLVVAYLLAPPGALLISGFVQDQLDTSRFTAEKLSILFVGILLYVACRLAGVALQKVLVNRVRELRALNRFGGAFFGAVKGAIVVLILLFFLALIPKSVLKDHFPALPKSRAYQWAAESNPMGSSSILERIRRLRTTMSNPRKLKDLKGSEKIEELLSEYELKGALKDPKFVKSVKEGDYDALLRNEQLEALMEDDELVDLLEELEEIP